MKPNLLLALAATSVVLVACDDDDDDNGTEPQPTALVRVVNASSSTATADLYVGNQSTALGSGIATGTAGATCFNVPTGDQTLNFRQGGGTSSIASAAPFNFVAGQRYTVVLTGTGTAAGARQAVVLTDNTVTAPATGQNAIRFFNATGASGDVYVTAAGAAPGTANQTGLASNTATTGGTGGFSTYPTTSTQVRVFPAGGATTGNPTVNFTIPTLPGNRVATIVLTGGAAGSQAFVAVPCP
jgi:hypothetical protein